MRHLNSILAFLVSSATTVSAQTVTIDRKGVHSDGKRIVLATQLGGAGSEHAELAVVNRFPGEIRYRTHLHADENPFLRFHREDGLPGDLDGSPEGRLNTTDDTSDVFPVYALKRGGSAGIYQDVIGIDAWDAQTDRHLGYAEVPVLVTFRAAGAVGRGRPRDFEMWEILPGRLARLRQSDLPLWVYSNHDDQFRAGSPERKSSALISSRALTVWNQAARGAGLPDLFATVDDERKAEITIDWSGDGLPRNALGQARIARGDPAIAAGVTMRRPSGDRPDALIAEDLLQELGHLVGLGHSGDFDDMMGPHQHAGAEYAGHERLEFVSVTQRDIAALKWLYAQEEFVPIVPRRSLKKGGRN